MKPSHETKRIESVVIANPLPQALAHYTSELSDTLTRIGTRHKPMNTMAVEGGQGVRGKLIMASHVVNNVAHGLKQQDPVFVTWPSVGLLDAQLWSRRQHNNMVVLHDPVPIRKQVGFDSLSKKLASLRNRYSPIVISHSKDALAIAEKLLPSHTHVQLPHPIASTQRTAKEYNVAAKVIVAGQFKPERDVQLLRSIGPVLREMGIATAIYGRGWPDIPGWDVQSRFLSESEMDHALSAASVILIPYQRYYQSGVAVRALELGTVSLSPPNSFAFELLGLRGIVPSSDPKSWIVSITTAIESKGLAPKLFKEYQSHVDESWSHFFNDAISGSEVRDYS